MLDVIRHTLPHCSGIFSSERNEDVYGWKKVFARVYGSYGCTGYRFVVIAKLIIPKDAGVVCGISKCRASRATVDGFYAYDHLFTPSPDDELSLVTAHSAIDQKFLYSKGSDVVPDFFDPDPTLTCSHGIHFFRSYGEAAAYDFK